MDVCKFFDKDLYAMRSEPGAVATGSHCASDLSVKNYPVATAPGFDLNYSVRVTFDSDLGASGSSPFASASSAANSCAGMM